LCEWIRCPDESQAPIWKSTLRPGYEDVSGSRSETILKNKDPDHPFFLFFCVLLILNPLSLCFQKALISPGRFFPLPKNAPGFSWVKLVKRKGILLT